MPLGEFNLADLPEKHSTHYIFGLFLTTNASIEALLEISLLSYNVAN
jgi:hypothetical protein